MDELNDIRKEIDEIDTQLLELLSRRIDAVHRIGKLKSKIGKPVVDEKREAALIEVLTKKGGQFKMTREIIEPIWRAIFGVAYIIEAKEHVGEKDE